MNKLRFIARMLAAALAMVLCVSIASPAKVYAENDTANAANTSSKKIVISNSDFETIVNCGIDGYAAYDIPTRVDITVTSAKDFTGSIRLIPNADQESWMTKVAYEQDITLVQGEAKTFTFYPTSMGESGKMKIALLDEKGREIYAETDKANLFYRGENIMIGILSEDYTALNYMDGIYVESNGFGGNTKILEMTASNFPEKQDALGALTYLVIDNFDTAKLSEEQYMALKGWVNSGGILVLSLGANYQNVLHIFTDDFVSGTIGELKKDTVTWKDAPVITANTDSAEDQESEDSQEKSTVNSDVNTEEYVDSPDNASSAVVGEMQDITLDHVDVLEFTMEDGEELSGFSENKTAYKKEIGKGAVVVLSYDLAMEPISSCSSANALTYALITATTTNHTFELAYQDTSYYTSTGADIASSHDSTKRPNAVIMGIVLVVYVVLVGPVLYLILKKVNQREKIWLAIPATALVFTLVIFLFTLTYQVGNPIVNTFSIVELEGDVQSEQVYTSITCPMAKEYELLLNGDYPELNYDAYNWDYSFFSENDKSEYDYMLKETNEGRKIVLANDSVFENTKFSLGRTTENVFGKLDLDLSCYLDRFEGTVTNNTIYDLENVIVYYENHYYKAGDLKKGESVSLKESDMLTFNMYGTFDWYNYTTNILNINDSKYIQAQIDSLMENTYVTNDGQVGGIWAYIPDYQVMVCEEENVEQSGCGAVYQSFTKEYEDVTGAYYPDIAYYMINYSGDYDPSDNMMYTEVLEMVYDFKGNEIASLINKNYEGDNSADDNYYYEGYGDVYAYNIETQSYDRIFVDSAIVEQEQLKKYLDGDRLILRFETDEIYSSYVPTISAIGGE